jgi:hypothetical protein
MPQITNHLDEIYKKYVQEQMALQEAEARRVMFGEWRALPESEMAKPIEEPKLDSFWED